MKAQRMSNLRSNRRKVQAKRHAALAFGDSMKNTPGTQQIVEETKKKSEDRLKKEANAEAMKKLGSKKVGELVGMPETPKINKLHLGLGAGTLAVAGIGTGLYLHGKKKNKGQEDIYRNVQPTPESYDQSTLTRRI